MDPGQTVSEPWIHSPISSQFPNYLKSLRIFNPYHRSETFESLILSSILSVIRTIESRMPSDHFHRCLPTEDPNHGSEPFSSMPSDRGSHQTVSEPWIRARQCPNHGSGPDRFGMDFAECSMPSDRGSHQTVSEPWIRARQFPNHGSGPDRFGMDFAECYYGTFDSDRANLVRLYKETSIMTLEGQKYHGLESIARKLTEIPFELCKHYISTVDCQPSGPAGDMLVFVSGLLHFRFAGEEHHQRFSQIFSLTLTPEGSFVIQNDIFRLNYG